MDTPDTVEHLVAESDEGMRLDVYLTGQLEDASRSFIKKLVKEGRVRINGSVCTRPARTMTIADEVSVDLPAPPTATLQPEPIALNVEYEDRELIVVNKPAGLVVHPAPGHHSGTLVHGLLHYCPEVAGAGGDPMRPGIVHRLDRFTSGLLVVAKTPKAFAGLSEQVRAHAFDRRYLALVRGEFHENSGRIVAAIGRSTMDRKRMSVTGVGGRDAVTRFEVLERFRLASLLSVTLETGRTHQIRVHLRFAGRPVLGDPVYGDCDFQRWSVPPQVQRALADLKGQALHAERLGLVHPATGERLRFTVPPPPDFQAAVEALGAYASQSTP
jgi:23S rRNA pseudouridine1911/1915/1917 synthase